MTHPNPFEDIDLEAATGGEASPVLESIVKLLADLDDNEIHVLQSVLDTLNPIVDADAVDLGTQLAFHLRSARAVLAEANLNKFTPINQKVAAVNGVSKALQEIYRLQQATYNIERFKSMEDAISATLRNHPDAAALTATFKETYERLIGAKIKERIA